MVSFPLPVILISIEEAIIIIGTLDIDAVLFYIIIPRYGPDEWMNVFGCRALWWWAVLLWLISH